MLLAPIAAAFQNVNADLFLVGGSVRDAALGRVSKDFDLTTSLRPHEIRRVVEPHADAVWEGTGEQFGTVSFTYCGEQVEITTFRADSYDGVTRKPTVEYGDNVVDDLSRRDLTMNAIAVSMRDGTVVDPFNGLADLREGVLRTPQTPEVSFSDDPLRMMRCSRFAAQLGFRLHPDALKAMRDMCGRIDNISVERVQGELDRILESSHPSAGFRMLRTSGILQHIVPELPASSDNNMLMRAVADVQFETLPTRKNVVLAALFIDGKVSPNVVNHRLKTLRFPSDVGKTVSILVKSFEQFGRMSEKNWDARQVRKFCFESGSSLDGVRALNTASLERKVSHAKFMKTFNELSKAENLGSISAELSGTEVMNILQTGPGRHIGDANKFLLDHYFVHGRVGKRIVGKRLKEWWERERVKS